jgi:hypothetical protein
LGPLALSDIGQNALRLDVLVLLEVIERERRSVASAGTRPEIHLMTAARRPMPLLLLLLVNSPLFAVGRHHQRRLVSAVLLLLDAAVSAVLRPAGIGIQRMFRSPLAAVVIIIRLIVVIVMVLVIAGR